MKIMTTKWKMVSITLILFGSTTVVCAESNNKYVSLKLGASILNVSNDEGFQTSDGEISDLDLAVGHVVSGAIGMYMHTDNHSFRWEVEVTNQINEMDSFIHKSPGGKRQQLNMSGSDVSITTFLLNGYKDITIQNKLSAYITTGLGVAYSEMTTDNASLSYDNHIISIEDDSDGGTSFVWQVGAGFGYDLIDNIVINTGYRYLGDSSFGSTSSGGHHVTTGLRYSF
jgi:opacity protein-like surface antigen